jgi:hypothetical protein
MEDRYSYKGRLGDMHLDCNALIDGLDLLRSCIYTFVNDPETVEQPAT